MDRDRIAQVMLAEAAYRDAAGMPRTAAWARAIAGGPDAIRAHLDWVGRGHDLPSTSGYYSVSQCHQRSRRPRDLR